MAKRDGLSSDGLAGIAFQRGRERRQRELGAMNRWAARKLEAIGETPKSSDPSAPSTKPKRKRSKARGSKKATMIEAAARAEVDRLVTKEAQRNGDYRHVPFTDVEVTEGGKRVKKEDRRVRNLARTQVERWHSKGFFDERQMAAILFYQDAFRKMFGDGARVTANYSPVRGGAAGFAIELWASTAYRAKEALRLLDQEVFFRLPVEHFEVWQNVVIWDEPCGVAGGRAGFCHKPGEAVAKVIVLTIAGMIADIVIDSSRKDFGNLLLDIDAPRKAGKARP
jgi:hypothetical protein